MTSRDMKIAEAVRDACIGKWGDGALSFSAIDLAAIIASIHQVVEPVALSTPDAVSIRRDAFEECAKICADISDIYQVNECRIHPELRTDAQDGSSDCEQAIRAVIAADRAKRGM